MSEALSGTGNQDLFEKGLKIRREVVGDAYVDRALANGSSDFSQPMQQIVTETCWGLVWSRPGISRRDRSIINLAMLSALNRSPELGNHVRGAIRNGVTEVEIREVLLQVSQYCGMPAGLEAFKVAETVINDMKSKGEFPVEQKS